MSDVKIPEKDKPFILALVSAGVSIINIVLLGLGAWYGNEDLSKNAMESLKFTFPLTTMAWTFYFKAKI